MTVDSHFNVYPKWKFVTKTGLRLNVAAAAAVPRGDMLNDPTANNPSKIVIEKKSLRKKDWESKIDEAKLRKKNGEKRLSRKVWEIEIQK